MRKGWFLLLGLVAVGAAGSLIVLYTPLFDLGLGLKHNALELVLGETPQAKAEAYLGAIRRQDVESALARWPEEQCRDAEHRSHRLWMTDELADLGPSLHYRIVDQEWWPSAGRVWIRVEIGDREGQFHTYTLEIVQLWPPWQRARHGLVKRFEFGDDLFYNPARFVLQRLSKIIAVRRWTLHDVYQTDESGARTEKGMSPAPSSAARHKTRNMLDKVPDSARRSAGNLSNPPPCGHEVVPG